MTGRSHILRAVLGAALVLAMQPALAAVGASVLVQTWDPMTPKKQGLAPFFEDKTIVTDQIQKAWTQARPRICAALSARMGQGGFAAGQTLRDIKCLLDDRVDFSVANSGSGALAVSLAVGGAVEATSTQPTVLGSWADPRFSLALRGHLNLAMSVQPDPAQTLRVDSAKFSISDAALDSHNTAADIVKFVADTLLPFFGGPQFRKLGEDAINAQDIETRGYFNTALAPVNAKLRGPSEYVRVAVWGRPDAIIVAFGPKPLTPPGGGVMSGALRWDASRVIAPGSCDSFSMTASVQTGPAPLRDPNGYFEAADAPMRQVGTFRHMRAAAANECGYSLSGLAAGWPNEVVARSSIGATQVSGNSLVRVGFSIVGDGWDGHTVVPQPNALRNYLVRGSATGEATIDAAAAAKARARSPGDPVVNPATLAATPLDRAPDSRAAAAATAGPLAAKPSLATTINSQQKAEPPALNSRGLAPSTLTPAQVPSALR